MKFMLGDREELTNRDLLRDTVQPYIIKPKENSLSFLRKLRFPRIEEFDKNNCIPNTFSHVTTETHKKN